VDTAEAFSPQFPISLGFNAFAPAAPRVQLMTEPAATSSPSPELEFWFDFASNYSYLSVMRIEDEALKNGVRIVWRPFLLGLIFRAMGMENSPFVTQKEKGVYVWRDMVRQCQKYGITWQQPSAFPRLGVLPSRVALLGADEPWIGTFCRNVMELNFAFDQEVNQPENIGPILSRIGLPADDLLRRAQSEPIKDRLRQRTDQARARGIFGAPTFFLGSEMYWGNDRLDDAIRLAANQR
jgi:2-hydroxychromene-2-carboxylate isomerase